MKINIEWKLAWALPVIECITEKLSNGGDVWEWGSGDSTIWLYSMATRIISIEHKKEFFDTFRLPCIRLIEPEESNVDGFIFDPDSYKTSEDSHKTFKKYCSSIDSEQPFDVIIIDGRARPSCMKHAQSKIKPNGIIVLDDAERTYYEQSIKRYMPGAIFYWADKTKSTAIWRNY